MRVLKKEVVKKIKKCLKELEGTGIRVRFPLHVDTRITEINTIGELFPTKFLEELSINIHIDLSMEDIIGED